jgi:hypothetical protein
MQGGGGLLAKHELEEGGDFSRGFHGETPLMVATKVTKFDISLMKAR